MLAASLGCRDIQITSTHGVIVRMCVCVLNSLQLCPIFPILCNPPGSSVHGILQARTLEWVAMAFSRGSSQPRNHGCSCIAGRFFTAEPLGKPSSEDTHRNKGASKIRVKLLGESGIYHYQHHRMNKTLRTRPHRGSKVVGYHIICQN